MTVFSLYNMPIIVREISISASVTFLTLSSKP
jgi:hypothetical protein